MADEGFHEIQLGKKQLLFVGMAAALYSVVVFSLGVWVGQDVRRPESEVAAEAREVLRQLGLLEPPGVLKSPQLHGR